MKTFKIALLLTVLFCSGHYSYAQPGEESDKKYNIHEIKLYEREDGSRTGASTWFTNSPDSVQKFVIRNLGIMEPVQVLLQSLSPNDEVTMQFVKQKWDEPESSISAKGKTIGKKIFRTYKTAAMSIKAQKVDIPYLILVQVGKKLPIRSTPLFRITNDKNEYEEYLKNKGKTAVNRIDAETAVIPVDNNQTGGGNAPNNSSLLYIIIGLLALMVVLLVYFTFVRKGNKKLLLMLLLFGLGFYSSWGQSDGPTPLTTEEINNLLGLEDVLAPQDGDVPIIEFGSPEWYAENPIPIIETEGGMTEDEFKKMVLDMREDYLNFKRDFIDEMPGEDTEGGTRTIPPGINEEELNELRARIRNLERQVAFLSDQDRSYGPEEDDQEQILVLCLDIKACDDCTRRYDSAINDRIENFRKLNRIMRHNDWEMEYAIDTGNNLANMAPGMALGWQSQLVKIQNARKRLWRKYHVKYGAFMTDYWSLINTQKTCHDTYNPEGKDTNHFLEQAELYIQGQAPELITPVY